MTRATTITALVEKWRTVGVCDFFNGYAAGCLTCGYTELLHARNRCAQELADTLSALGGRPEKPRKVNACINCGDADDGGFEIGNENESFVGPFCSTCWEYVNKHSAAPGGRPETGWQPIATAPKEQACSGFSENHIQIISESSRMSKLEDAAFHFQTCRVCRKEGDDACPSGRKFAAFLRGEPDGD